MEDLLALAERSSPEVRAAALMRIARVHWSSHRDLARQTLDRAISEMLALSSPSSGFLLAHARLHAAAVAPELLETFPASYHRFFGDDSIVRALLSHANINAAFQFVMSCTDGAAFPYRALHELLHRRLGSGSQQLFALRHASAMPTADQPPGFQFIECFAPHCTLPPEEEARLVVQRIVRQALRQPDRPTQTRFQSEIQFDSTRQATFFQVLHILHSPAIGPQAGGVAGRFARSAKGRH